LDIFSILPVCVTSAPIKEAQDIMATIVERKGRFLVRVRRDGFKPVCKTFTMRKDATAWGRRVEADMEAGRWVEDQAPAPVVPTLAQAVRLYREGPAKKLKGSATYSYWFDELETSAIAAKRVPDITPFDLSAWRDAQEQSGLKPGTVVRKLGLLSGLLTWCQKERGWLASNPMRSVSKPRVNDARDRTFTADELAHLQAAAKSGKAPWLADALVVLVRSAMRRGELWGLKVCDIDFKCSTAHLRDTKNGSARDVPLDPVAREALQRLAASAKAKAKASTVVVDIKPGTATGDESIIPVGDPAAISLAFRRTVARARRDYMKDCKVRGIDADAGFLVNVKLHDARHTAVSRLAETGALSMVELMAVSGHKSPRMTLRYSHLSASALAAKLAQVAA